MSFRFMLFTIILFVVLLNKCKLIKIKMKKSRIDWTGSRCGLNKFRKFLLLINVFAWWFVNWLTVLQCHWLWWWYVYRLTNTNAQEHNERLSFYNNNKIIIWTVNKNEHLGYTVLRISDDISKCNAV